jgi:hypothetical protein
MSEVIGRQTLQTVQQLIEKSRFGVAAEERLFLKGRDAHRLMKERMRLIDDVEDALRKVRATRE